MNQSKKQNKALETNHTKMQRYELSDKESKTATFQMVNELKDNTDNEIKFKKKTK